MIGFTSSEFDVLKLWSGWAHTLRTKESRRNKEVVVENSSKGNEKGNNQDKWILVNEVIRPAAVFDWKRKKIYGKAFNVYSDRLIIKYEYVKNGVTKYYNINSFNVPAGANTKPSELETCYVKNSIIDAVYYEPSFTDCIRRKIGGLSIQYAFEVDMLQPQLIWTRTTDQHYFRDDPCDDGLPTDNSDFIIPANMVLTKLN